MEKYIWNYFGQQSWDDEKKKRSFLACSIFAFGLIGAIVWVLIGRMFLPGIDWLLCFIGYPAVFLGFFGGTIYLARNDT